MQVKVYRSEPPSDHYLIHDAFGAIIDGVTDHAGWIGRQFEGRSAWFEASLDDETGLWSFVRRIPDADVIQKAGE